MFQWSPFYQTLWLICMNQSKFSNSFAKLKHFKTSMSLQKLFPYWCFKNNTQKCEGNKRCDNTVITECLLWLECWLWMCKNRVTNTTCLIGLFANLDRVRTSSVMAAKIHCAMLQGGYAFCNVLPTQYVFSTKRIDTHTIKLCQWIFLKDRRMLKNSNEINLCQT